MALTRYEIEDVVLSIKLGGPMSNWRLDVRCEGYESRSYLQVVDLTAFCNVTDEPAPWSGRKWFLSPHMTASEIVQTALKAVLTAMEHEIRENFKYRGVTVFDPHLDVDALVEFRKTHQLSVRTPPS